MKKHAYLLMVHNHEKQVEVLLSLLRFNHQQPDFQSFRSPVHHAFNNAQNTSLSIHNSSLGRRSRITCSKSGTDIRLDYRKENRKSYRKTEQNL